MKIVVLNGSPKGQTSVTMQYVRYIQEQFPEHEREIVHVARRLRRIESRTYASIAASPTKVASPEPARWR